MLAQPPITTLQEEVLTFLASAPTPEQIIAFQSSAAVDARVGYLLAANQTGTLTEAEQQELDEVSYLNHFFILLKAKARKALNQVSPTP